MLKGRDVWWEDEIKKVETQGNPFFAAEEMDAEDLLFVLYTSGSTGNPKVLCIPAQDTWFGPIILSSMFFNTSRDRSISVLRTLDGSLAIVI
jgi:acyl-coenzyme A synthetase/AMP-(fatty) acid ligase